MVDKVVATNRKAKFEFILLEHFEAGISLKGSEIKSVREGKVSLTESYIQVEGKNVWLVSSHIAPYDPASRENHDPERNRRLLLNIREIRKLREGTKQKGLTIIPVKMYLKNGLAKLDIALAKGKKLYDKRHTIARRDLQRELERNGKSRLK